MCRLPAEGFPVPLSRLRFRAAGYSNPVFRTIMRWAGSPCGDLLALLVARAEAPARAAAAGALLFLGRRVRAVQGQPPEDAARAHVHWALLPVLPTHVHLPEGTGRARE
jgi:hypothetical protein